MCQSERGQKQEVLFSTAGMGDAEAVEQMKTQRGEEKRERVRELPGDKCIALHQPLQYSLIPTIIFLSERALSIDKGQ